MNLQLINQAFDHIYVLTMERAKDRHERFKGNFEGLNIEFFYGVDRRDINFDSKEWTGTREYLLSYGIDLPKIDKSYEREPGGMHPGEVACSIGHLNIYKDMVNKGYRKVLILEDDAIFYPTQIENLEPVIQDLPKSWDLLYFGFRGNGQLKDRRLKSFFYILCHYLHIGGWQRIKVPHIKQMYPKPYSNFWMTCGEHMCTHAYAISLPFAQRLIEMQQPIQYPSDRLLSFAILDDYDFKGFTVKESLLGQLEEFPELSAKSYINTD